MVTARTSDRLLESAVKASGTPEEVIGDALSPRTPFEAISEADRGARSIKAADLAKSMRPRCPDSARAVRPTATDVRDD